MSNLKSYRSCFVPLCTNTTKATPGKIFLNVPQDEKRRNKWFQAVHRDNPKTKSILFCCEDHFDLKDDIENYIYYIRYYNDSKTCCKKRRRQQIIKEILSESSESITIGNPHEPNIDAVSANPFENIDSDPLNVTPVGTQTNINNRTVAVQVNSRLKYRSVSILAASNLLNRISFLKNLVIINILTSGILSDFAFINPLSHIARRN